MIGRTNAGGSGGGLNKSVIIVTAPTGSTVTCKSGTTTKTAAEKNGTWTFTGLDNGTWTITATKSGQTATKSVTISRLTVEYVTITYFSATINITYPAGSICTVKNGSTTLTAPNTSGTWPCIVPNAGDWTVSCTDGTQAASKTISITEDGQSVSVALAYWDGELYDNGNQYTAITGGWMATHDDPVNYTEFATNSIVFHNTGDTTQQSAIYTNNTIDITNFSILRVVCNVISCDGSAFGITKSKGASSPSFVSKKEISTTGKQTLDLDISSQSGEYYVSVTNLYGEFSITKIYLI